MVQVQQKPKRRGRPPGSKNREKIDHPTYTPDKKAAPGTPESINLIQAQGHGNLKLSSSARKTLDLKNGQMLLEVIVEGAVVLIPAQQGISMGLGNTSFPWNFGKSA